MCQWVGSHAPSFERQLWGAAQPCGVPLTAGGIAPVSLGYVRLCGSSCGTPLAGRRAPLGLCAGSPVTGSFHGSG